MDFYKRAYELKEQTVFHRRYFHENAETGLDMPIATEYVINTLKEYGIAAEKCGHGITAQIGQGEPVILLRADMDALPMNEESGETFSCKTGASHGCGHDMHSAMLLTAAKMLKESENELKGTVRLMFQPAEETLQGCCDMLENGILNPPEPKAALSFHTAAGKIPVGAFMYNSKGVMMCSADSFRILINGKSGHGAYPYMAVDALRIAAHIYSALDSLITKESDPEKSCTLTIGSFHGGNAANIISDKAVMEGMLRTDDINSQKKLICRIKELSEGIALMYGGTAEIQIISHVPPLICDSELTEKMKKYISELNISDINFIPDIKANASEDFAHIAERIPSVFIYLTAGFEDERGAYTAHHSKVRYNEDVLPIGAAAYAHCAYRFLRESSK